VTFLCDYLSVESPETVRPQSWFVFAALSWWISVAALLCLLPSVAEGTVAFSWRYRDLLEVPCLAEGTVALWRRCRVIVRVPWLCGGGAVSLWGYRGSVVGVPCLAGGAVTCINEPLSILSWCRCLFCLILTSALGFGFLLLGFQFFPCVLTVVAWKIHLSVARDLV
jgi:hypothetical protein